MKQPEGAVPGRIQDLEARALAAVTLDERAAAIVELAWLLNGEGAAELAIERVDAFADLRHRHAVFLGGGGSGH